MLLFVYPISILGRQILGISMEPIRLELDPSDTQLGFLFRIASHTPAISISIAAWSAMTAVCGLTRNFRH